MKIDGHFVVDSQGRSDGLMLFWKSSFGFYIQSYLGGHIDCIISQDQTRWRFTGFRETIENCNLSELMYKGDKFTWCNKRKGEMLNF